MSGPPEGFPVLVGANSGKTLAKMVAGGPDPDGAMSHARECDLSLPPGVPFCPCYVCGEPGGCFCRECRRTLCDVCSDAGGHDIYALGDGRHCEFIIPGRSPDAGTPEEAA